LLIVLKSVNLAGVVKVVVKYSIACMNEHKDGWQNYYKSLLFSININKDRNNSLENI